MTQAFNLSQLANNLNSSGQLDATDGLVNAVPVANGGTGASSASSARSNLGVPANDGTGASGTWGINISGNAATATSATSATNATNATNATTAASCSGNSATVTNGVYTTNFTGSNQSISANGYQKLPGGLIIQWGRDNDAGNTEGSVTFPLQFPNAVFCITTGAISNGTGAQWVYQERIRTDFTTSGFNYQCSTDSGMFWMAIGY
jgi:hypothetical protein